MQTSSRKGKVSAIILANLLSEYGVRKVIVSPGSRNMPIIEALNDSGGFDMMTVVDERQAAFIALGLSSGSRKPVALVCTSGSALLNYAPAISEAYYRSIPLIVISADRPFNWIDRMDSQTIRQPNALQNIVKTSIDIPDCKNPNHQYIRYIHSRFSESFISALTKPTGPVHINMQFDEPLSDNLPFTDSDMPIIRKTTGDERLSRNTLSEFCNRLAGKRILIIAGQMHADHKLSRALSRLRQIKSIWILAENLSNLKVASIVPGIDRTLSAIGNTDSNLTPEILISIGGAVTSRKVKEWLRAVDNMQHWHVGYPSVSIPDTYLHLTDIIATDPAQFISAIYNYLSRRKDSPDYASFWQNITETAQSRFDSYVEKSEWSDLKAFSTIFRNLDKRSNISLSNGMAVRYSELFASTEFHSRNCNRGVSGIDGCTSTAIGEAITYSHNTILISGDMSFRYDISAITSDLWPDSLKAIVINNSGGDIFRIIKSTSDAHCREEYLSASDQSLLPLEKLAKAMDFEYLKATNERETSNAVRLLGKLKKKAILEIFTPKDINADNFRNCISSLNKDIR